MRRLVNSCHSLAVICGFAGVYTVCVLGWGAQAQNEGAEERKTRSTSPCTLTPVRGIAFRCISFEGHWYAVADIDLHSEEILITTSEDFQRQTLPGVASNFARRGVRPILVTNGGIYGTDNRPLGLLISSAA